MSTDEQRPAAADFSPDEHMPAAGREPHNPTAAEFAPGSRTPAGDRGPHDPAASEARFARADFQATSDPAVGGGKLLSYRELYALWERQQWSAHEIDFGADRVDWQERFTAEEREQRLYGLSGFFVGEQRVAAELGPMMRAAPDEDMRLFLCTQIADEARHVVFFDRFFEACGIVEGDGLGGRLSAVERNLNEHFRLFFDEQLRSRVDKLGRDPDDLETLVEAITIYHMVAEGMLALTGQHFIIDYNERNGTLPGFVRGFTLVARDEHRHVAFGARFLRDMAQRDACYAEAIQRTLVEVGPAADGVLRPPWAEQMSVEEQRERLGASVDDTRAFALKALERRMRAIGLLQPA